MADRIQLEIVTPERRVLSEAVDEVYVPGLNGQLGILPGHTPLISQLQTGVLSYVQGGATRRLLVSGGFVEAGADRVSVLAEVAERPEEVDVARARAEREQYERAINSWQGGTDGGDFEETRTKFERADVRLQLASGNSSS